VFFKYNSTNFPHFLISYFDAALAYPYPGASTKYDLCIVFSLKNTNYFVLPGFLLVSFTGTPINLFIKELFPILLLPKNTN
jgi:hypothetical protein